MSAILIGAGGVVGSRGERAVHIDDSPTGALASSEGIDDVTRGRSPTDDPICCMVASDKILVVARESGALNRYI